MFHYYFEIWSFLWFLEIFTIKIIFWDISSWKLQRMCYCWYLSNKLTVIENIKIKLSYGPKWPSKYHYSIYGHTFLAITQLFFGQSSCNIVWEFRGLLSIDWWFREIVIMIFIILFLEGKWAWPPRWRQRFSGLMTRSKVDSLDVPLSQKSVFKKFRAWTHPP